MSQAWNDNDSSGIRIRFYRFLHERKEEIGEEEMSKMIAGHVQLQAVFGHVLFGHSHTSVENEDVKSDQSKVR